MPKITNAKQRLPKLSFSESTATRLIKDKCRHVNTSPRQRPHLQYYRNQLKHLSCPIKAPPKRLLYQCPKCHRLRNFLDDRDKFILYGVTRLWPTPPPAPPPISSPSSQLGDNTSSHSILEGAYNICRIFQTRSAKLNPRNPCRKKSPSSPTLTNHNKQLPKSTTLSLSKSTSVTIDTGNNDLVHMVHMLKKCVSPSKGTLKDKAPSNDEVQMVHTLEKCTSPSKDTLKDKAPSNNNVQMVHTIKQCVSPSKDTLKDKAPSNNNVQMVHTLEKCASTSDDTSKDKDTSNNVVQMVHTIKKCVSLIDNTLNDNIPPSSNVTQAVTVKLDTPPISVSTVKKLAMTEIAFGSTSPKRSRVSYRSGTSSKFLKLPSSYSVFPTRDNYRQSISPKRLELWTKRLRSGVYLNKTGYVVLSSPKDTENTVSGESEVKRKKKRKKKHSTTKLENSKGKSTEVSQINISGTLDSGMDDKLNDWDSKSAASSNIQGIGSHNEKLSNTIVSSSRAETVKNRMCTIKRISRPVRHNSEDGDCKQELAMNTKVIEAVKIGEEKVTVTKVHRRVSKRRITKKSVGTVNLTEINLAPDVADVSDSETAKTALSCTPSLNSVKPERLLCEFKSRMSKCQGKGSIQTSQIEVTAYVEDRKSETKFQYLPKTYQQLGLGPLTRSPSTENQSQFSTHALSDTEIVPKTSHGGHSRRRKKRRKRDKSMPNSSSQKTESEIPKIKLLTETKISSQHVKQTTTPGKQKSRFHQMSTAAVATTITTVAALSS